MYTEIYIKNRFKGEELKRQDGVIARVEDRMTDFRVDNEDTPPLTLGHSADSV